MSFDALGLQPYEPSARNAIDGRLWAAAMLVQAVLLDLDAVEATDLRNEMRRRELEVIGRALLHQVAELGKRLVRMRRRLPFGVCAHCGWGRPPTRLGRCPRCEKLRESLPAAVPSPRPRSP